MTNIALLNQYAKQITSTQAKMLYESKTHRKLGSLNESYNPKDMLSLYLDNFIIYETMSLTANEVVNKFLKKYAKNIKYKMLGEGVEFLTSNKDVYENMIIDIEEMGVSPEDSNALLDSKYLNGND